jgi:hypothetical protein
MRVQRPLHLGRYGCQFLLAGLKKGHAARAGPGETLQGLQDFVAQPAQFAVRLDRYEPTPPGFARRDRRCRSR